MKKLALFLFATSLFAGACKKDERGDNGDIKPAGGTFTIEGRSYLSNYTYWNGADGLVLTNIPQAPSYIENAVQIFVDSLYFSHSYTYMDRNDAAYDRKKHFYNAKVRYSPNDLNGNELEITGVTAGTMEVSREAETFTIDYDITVAGRQMRGTYIGKVAGKKW
jgi:hypothetical protein